MDAIKIDLNDWVHSGEGANGESYYHKSDPSVMMKLYFESAPYEIIVSELEFAQKVYDAGISTPKPGELVTDGNGRFGIRFERIVGKKSFSRACGDDPSRVEEYARAFARMCLKLHSTKVSREDFPDIKTLDLSLMAENPYFEPEERVWVEEFIKNAPEGDTAIHGDLQFSNAITSPQGDYFIDLGDFACGHPYFDLGMVLLCTRYDGEDFVRDVFHMDLKTADAFWVYFVKEYFGEDADPDEIDTMLRPYAGLKVLIIERNAGMYFPQFHDLFKIKGTDQFPEICSEN